MEKILVIGSNGQLGSELSSELCSIYGKESIICSDIREPLSPNGTFEHLDVLDSAQLSNLIDKHRITELYHLAAVLSAKGEQNPIQTWDINMRGLLNVLEVAKNKNIKKVFYPSSIAVFGATTPSPAPQFASFNPSTIYGISKLAGEQWCAYYHKRYGLDVRSLRYPGLISHKTLPGGGTTDYAVDIFYKAVAGEEFTCFLSENMRLPMMYMPDAVRATIEVMQAPSEKISIHSGYNLNAFDCTPKELTNVVQSIIPSLSVSYKVDELRESIADSWTDKVDDQLARKDWGWSEEYHIERMTKEMIKNLRK